MNAPVALPILESSQAGEARRIALAIATRLGFNETERGQVGIVVTEIANNLVLHAKDGLLLLQPLSKNEITGIEILALDKGPGISNIQECLRDGFSTAGTPGNGLGAVSRLSAFFEIHSVPNVGTALLSHLWACPEVANQSTNNLEIGVVCLPMAGEEVSGDGWATDQQPGRSLLLVADGLGHGPLAAQASLEAIQIFRENVRKSPAEIIEAAHVALRSTRGAALAIAEVDFKTLVVRFAGVGNIAGSVFSPAGSYSMVSHNGTVGHEVRKIQEFVYQWPQGGLLVMHSDGLSTQWRLDRYAGLITRHPSLIAGVLYRDFYRGRDDITVLVAREED
ncbi:SpoIIE family protein phosphatase [Coleofasciculus sp. FACHB-64]|uniref:ATP-binding SpoIIE family protein phosphatase n=1 Tax=Cyanophyceae TaxID=3028117 RepID=UPI0016842539|nr:MULTISPECIES: ATP-binding SpoIIE family protein phosphatase [unclassified Coleofasciculus]MBD1836782.1 SpoIIE family protein phosphatase [Coleofasciculus sp. FACHB-501]MBD1878549.1 SpoIIE family protein phosphatase [Coleofasciculus sp. FACHB-T130]MBD1891951.1 SpoIIE family protein phosphatase [Coleofasciculus sp. FACHB-SPT9]MBD1898312.1 SpoIIE family protein phosphatase [Coleofasciculus sp. FACHB-129]MBD1903407.1 SpoIIE family protein phosphatase [Coleofasciculus sp. FACHB-125]